MKELVKFELYKIFSKKLVIAMILICTILSVLPSITDYLDMKGKGLKSYENIKKIGQEYEGQVITEEKMNYLEEIGTQAMVSYNNGEEITDKEKVIAYGINDFFIWVNPDYVINNKFYNLNDMKKDMNKLEKEGANNTYEYKELKYVRDLIEKKPIPKFYFKFGWRDATDFNMTPMWIGILIIVSICTIFSNEYQSNTASIIFSSKNGQGKLTLAKVISGLLFSTIMFIIINGIQIIIMGMHGFEGWNLPMSFLPNAIRTPYIMNIGTFYMFGLLVSYIGVVLFTLLVMLVSLVIKNNMISFAISFVIYLGPSFLARIMPTYILTKIFMELNIENLIGPIMVFGDTSTYNIFGKPTLHLNVLVTIALISIPIVLYLINRLGKRQVV
ncbi:ABC transporter permease subunit [Paraclostridium ghonii]|uniref:ABC-type transport system involved in multi-copper enzyme maturation permease subunit n=1 Tax=Paraclostridium ghonii TaxID=29358 RepID=A0ABU0MY25_9FIRM|nr:ABC transporter permease subunit [Paeniclostridium ghonii]MDQ0555811.1 ABC-type transport system involved in multi-copper enzyme maturation permease subunit [Paeniclostridium ghonii]